MNDEEHRGGCLYGQVGYKVKGKRSFSAFAIAVTFSRNNKRFALPILACFELDNFEIEVDSVKPYTFKSAAITLRYIFVPIAGLPYYRLEVYRKLEQSLALIVGPSIRQPFDFHPQVSTFAGQSILLAT